MKIETYFADSSTILAAAPLIEHLARAFEREGIVYSHWKSNLHLAHPTGGDIDYDILVERGSLERALSVLAEFGFKAAVARWGANSPGISHYYGFDDGCAELVHVHLFSVVLTGESYVKSHLFPLENLLLQNALYSGAIRVTNKQAELVTFTLRTFVKYGSLPDLLTLWRKAGSIEEEIRWLQDGNNLGPALSLLKQHCPVIEEPLFVRCVEALKEDSSLVRRIVLARQVRRRLNVYARRNFWERQLAYGQVLMSEAQRRLCGKRKNKVLQAGGAVIAFVGAEATGKSTLVGETARWLGSAFAVRTVHAGKPPATLVTAPVRLLLPLLRRGLSALRTNRLEGHSVADEGEPGPDRLKGFPSLLYATRAVILAWERRQLLVGARRAAANGELVICDRYPADTVGAMDSPRLHEQPSGRGAVSSMFNWLARLEYHLYQQIAPPDIVLRLRVDVETAQQRNRERVKAGKESDAYVASRHRQAREWHKAGTRYVYDIDTDRALPETIGRVKNAIWRSL